MLIHLPLAPLPATAASRDVQLAAAPYRGSRRADILVSDHSNLIYVFSRRPRYFVGAAYDRGNSGNTMQRFGPGIAWSPGRGTFIWSSNSATLSDDTWSITAQGYVEAQEHLPVTVAFPITGPVTSAPTSKFTFTGPNEAGTGSSTVTLSTNALVTMTLTPTGRDLKIINKQQYVLTFSHAENVRLGMTITVEEQ